MSVFPGVTSLFREMKPHITRSLSHRCAKSERVVLKFKSNLKEMFKDFNVKVDFKLLDSLSIL